MQTCAQVLLSLGNLASRIQYLNASNTFTELFSYGTVPIVNENDTVAVEELRIGDNDTLSAQASFQQPNMYSCGDIARIPNRCYCWELCARPADPMQQAWLSPSG